MKYFGFLLILFLSLTSLPAFASDNYNRIVSELCATMEKSTNSIAVVGFSYSDGRESSDGVVVAERVVTELIKLNKFPVVERKELEKVLNELKLQRTGLIDSNSSKDIGKMLGASSIIIGTLTELPENNIEMHIRVAEVETGKVLNASTVIIKKDWLDQYRKRLAEVTLEIEKNPKDEKAFYNSGLINNDLEDYDAAIANFGIAITINPTYQDAYYGRATSYSHKRNTDKALEDYNKALLLKPRDFRVYFDRGVTYFLEGDMGKAIEDFTSAISINPTIASTYYNRGQVYLVLKDYEKAISDYLKVNEIEPQWLFGEKPNKIRYSAGKNISEIWIGLLPKLMLGQAYYKNGECDKAILICDDILKSDSTSATSAYAYYFRGECHFASKKNGDKERALADLNMATKINPKFTDAYKARSFPFYMSEKATSKSNSVSDLIRSRTISDLSKVIEIAPYDAEAYQMRAMVYSFEKEYKKALSDFDMALELDPGLNERAGLGTWRNIAAAMVAAHEQ